LEGLEIKVTKFSETLNNKDFRIDGDFWTKISTPNSKLVYTPIGDILLKSQYGISISMNEEGVGYPIYRMNEIHNMLCDFEVNKHADISYEELKTFTLADGDVLFNRTNSYEWVGRTGLYKKVDDKNFIFASYLVRFIPDQEKVLPEYLVSFLNSRHGVLEVRRRARHSINQVNVNPEEVKAINIPLLSRKTQSYIKDNFEHAIILLQKSKTFYTKAEELLLSEIGLKDFTPSTEPVNIKSFKESFEQTGRLDAEYYQKKYADYLKLITAYRNGSALIKQCCICKIGNFNPNAETEYKYIELSNIDKSGSISGCTNGLGKELPSRARRLVYEQDVIVSSIEGSLGSCALVGKEYNNALCSTGFYVLSSDEINSETLVVLFKSAFMQNLLKQNCSGTILTAINKDDFLSIPIPLIRKEKQREIAILLQQSFMLKKQSESLLEAAKHAVEIAIEKDEETALKFLETVQNQGLSITNES
jgi:restriction endonuclease S subunit